MSYRGSVNTFQQRWLAARGLFASARAEFQSESLAAQMVRGGAWTLGLRVAVQAASLVQVAVLARLLAPEDFGLMGIALMTIGILEMVTDGGLAAALVQRRDDANPYLNTIFTVQLARGLVIGLGLFLAAPAVASFFDSPDATPIIKAMAVFAIVSGFSNPAMILYRRSLSFRPGSISALSGLIAGLIVTIPLAFWLRNVWALVLGMIASQATMAVGSYMLTSYRPRLEFDWTRCRNLTHFGKWVTASNIAYFVLLNGDNVMVGKVLGTTPLGLYRFAFNVSTLPVTEISNTISQVSFPAFASIQHDRQQLRGTYLRVLWGTALLALPTTVILLVSAPDLIGGVLGAQWLPALTAFQILCVFAASRSVIATTGPLFQGAGLPRIPTWIALGQLAFLAVVAYPATRRWELEGIAMAITAANVMALAVGLVLVAGAVEASLGEFSTALWPGLRAAIIMGAPLVAVRLLVEMDPLGRLILEMGIVALLSAVVLLPLMRGWRRTWERAT
jgi:lipopolysaccharide exporter